MSDCVTARLEFYAQLLRQLDEPADPRRVISVTGQHWVDYALGRAREYDEIVVLPVPGDPRWVDIALGLIRPRIRLVDDVRAEIHGGGYYVVAEGHSRVRAHGGGLVHAHGAARVEAYDSVMVVAHDSATVILHQYAQAVTLGQTQVEIGR